MLTAFKPILTVKTALYNPCIFLPCMVGVRAYRLAVVLGLMADNDMCVQIFTVTFITFKVYLCKIYQIICLYIFFEAFCISRHHFPADIVLHGFRLFLLCCPHSGKFLCRWRNGYHIELGFLCFQSLAVGVYSADSFLRIYPVLCMAEEVFYLPALLHPLEIFMLEIIYNPLAGSCIGIGSTATALHLDYHYPKILPIKPDLFFSSMYLASNMRAFFSSSLARFCSFSVRSSKSNIADNILWILS